MAQKHLKIFIIGIFINLFLPNAMKPCGYYEGEWEYRTMIFQAHLPHMNTLNPFNYTLRSLYATMDSDPAGSDRQRNINEWQHATSKQVKPEDIESIQYQTEALNFLYSIEKKDWSTFKNNTFIQFLLKPENKDLLEYMIFAKKAESTELYYGDPSFENWNEVGYNSRENEYGLKKNKIGRRSSKQTKNESKPFSSEKICFSGHTPFGANPTIYKSDRYLQSGIRKTGQERFDE